MPRLRSVIGSGEYPSCADGLRYTSAVSGETDRMIRAEARIAARISRRTLFAGTGAAIPSVGLPSRSWATAYPFALGVASGSPTPGGVILWTRLAPDPLSPDPQMPGGMSTSPVPVRWEIAEDEAMSRVIRSGMVDALPEFAHAVHVEVTGLA